jgi:Protein of unknown function (DUF3823) N-terminal domain/Domain of unknown function (DUF3823_C)
MMNKMIIGIMTASVLLAGYGCSKVDNYAAPNATFQGNIIDSVTGQNLLTETGGAEIELLQTSWVANPDPYYIPSKQDGSFQDTRIYSGSYSVIPTQGAFWPIADTLKTPIKGAITQNFTVVPYLEITNLQDSVNADSLVMTCNLMCPEPNGLPEVLEIWPFVNSTPFVGSGSSIPNYTISDNTNPSYNLATINSNWNATIAATTYRLVVHGLLPGRTYYARLGVRVNDSYKKYDFSPIVTFTTASK